MDIEKLESLLPFSKSLNILFVDDNEDVRIQIVKLLSNFFDNIDIACDGKEALDLYQNFHSLNGEHYDIVITDLSMPQMDGLTLSKEVKKQNEDQIILIISAYTHPDKLLDLINLGVNKFIQKPIDQKNILEILYSTIILVKERY